jgi:NADPH:quinone reductase
MRAVRVATFGLENVRVDELPDPSPGPGEVLIATEAATVNAADLGIVTGQAAARFPAGAVAPYTPGWDLAGRVIGSGDGVPPGLLGTRVVGFTIWFVTGRGTQASLVTLPASDVTAVPAAVSLASAQLTTVGLNGLTAWRGLADLNLAAGESVVITGATGGVGGFAVELAAARGLTVVALVRQEDLDEARALGAAAAVTADQGDVGEAVRGVLPEGADALLDTASIGQPALGALREGGRYVTVTVVPPAERGITVSRTFSRMDTEGLDMAGSGRLHTPVAQVFEVADARRAYQHFAGWHGRGRVVLTFDR